MASKKKILMENPKCDYFVEQTFPVEESIIGNQPYKEIRVVSYNSSPTQSFLCDFFKVEVIKDIDGLITFILIGKLTYYEQQRTNFDEIDIMRTDDLLVSREVRNFGTPENELGYV